MYCYKCGTHLPDDSNFCTACGVGQRNSVTQNENGMNNLKSVAPVYPVDQYTSHAGEGKTFILRMNNWLSLVAAILFFLPMITGSLFSAEYFSYYVDNRLELFNFCNLVRKIGKYSDSTLGKIVMWFAGNLGVIVICLMIIFAIYGIYRAPFGPLRFISLFVGTIAVICSFIVIGDFNDNLNIGSAMIMIIAGLIVGFISMVTDQEDKRQLNTEEDILQSGGWKCSSCGKIHMKYEGLCTCGMKKHNNGQ